MSGLEELPPAASAPGGAPDPDARLLRRVVPFRRDLGRGFQRAVACGCALDVEADGLDTGNARIVQLAMQRFYVAADGSICDVGRMHTWYEDPGSPLPREIVALTGIRDEDVRGRSICDAEAGSILLDVDFVVAHNASYDRPMVERRLPLAAGRPWMCSMRDVPWRDFGFEGASLSHLLLQTGWFYRAHSASVDVSALLRLLDHRLALTGTTVVAEGLARARRAVCLAVAADAPFPAGRLLRARGYRWRDDARRWEREIPCEAAAEETRWLGAAVYGGRRSGRMLPMDWTRRYAAA